ncbi:sugar-binding protein, partial [Pseudomonas sp. MWU12-2312b]
MNHTLQNDQHTQYLHFDDTPLAEQRLNDHNRTVLLLTNASHSVIGECPNGALRTITYSAYGIRKLFKEAELQSLLAFNGEACERLHGWYMLGRGYRVYNPGLMRFHSPDSLSPFAEGGVNPYVYCLGNPINLRDPSGHFARGAPPEPLPVFRGSSDVDVALWIGVAVAGVFLAATAYMMPWSAPLSIKYVVALITLAGQASGAAL